MKFIKPSFSIINQSQGLTGVYEQIETAGRLCYDSKPLYKWYSEDMSKSINENSMEWKNLPNPQELYPVKGESISAEKFVNNMISLGHGAVLEHGTVYLFVPINCNKNERFMVQRYTSNHYSNIETITAYPSDNNGFYITTNYRVIFENNWQDDLKYWCEPTAYHRKRVTVKFMVDRATGESFIRHRTIDEDHLSVEKMVTREMEDDKNSPMRQSTRYCNYSKDKYNNQLSVVPPIDMRGVDFQGIIEDWGRKESTDYDAFKMMCYFIYTNREDDFKDFDVWLFTQLACQWGYNQLTTKYGWQAQHARKVLPMDISSPLFMTGFVKDWMHFFSLRASAAGATGMHPEADEVASQLYNEFIKQGLIF